MDHILSVCSGIGGLDLGLHAGLRAVGRSPRTVCMVEREAFAVAVLGKAMQEGRLDDCPVWCGDLRDLPVEQLPRIDWITGGYPCQPFSHAGKRLGEDDPRHLWPVIREQVRALRPRGVFFENVAGHLTLGLDRVLRDLAGCGFRCAFGLFTAAEIGAPHRRERVFILGLADRDGRRLEERSERDGEQNEDRTPRRDDARRCDADLAYSQSLDRRTGSGGSQDREEPAARGQLADSDCERRRLRYVEWQDATDAREPSWSSWPSRPGESQYDWEPPRCIESRLGRGSDGLSDRVDRLRALGNAVVWQQAERAFCTLWKELTC